MTPENAFEQFKPTITKLHSEGFSSGDFSWWSSRWNEWLGYNHSDSKEEWSRKAELNKLFPQVWDQFKPEFTKRKLMTPILEKAIKYVTDWDFAVFPVHYILVDKCNCGRNCASPGKHPIPHIGFKAATKDLTMVEHFWQTNPSANIGIATGKISNIAVLDVDPKHEGDLSLKTLCDEIGEFSTYTVRTGSGGLHFYFRYPTDCEIKNSSGLLGKGLDIRGEGGYVVAPPSNHISGKNYEVLFDGVIAELPEKLKEKLLQPKQPVTPAPQTSPGIRATPTTQPYLAPDQILQGGRNIELTKLGGSLRRIGLSELAITSALQIENQRICQPPLDDAEVRRIAHSVSRYAPDEVLQAVADDPALQNIPNDFENTLQVFLYKDFRQQTFEPKEILGFEIGKRDVAMIAGATNAGKSTLLRNVLMCMAAGRPFLPFYEGIRPVKIVYFDLETDAEDLHKDTIIMDQVFTKSELDLLGENLIVVPKGILQGELFQFNRHENWISQLIKDNGIEFVVVDNVSAAFDLNDENSGSEVTKKVMKPLGKLAVQGHCGIVFAHHFGKGKTELEHAGVHASRGSSSFQNLSRTVFNMFGNVSKGEPVVVECAKRKTNGGLSYQQTMKLNGRWFENALIAPPPKKQTAYQQIRDYLKSKHPDEVKAAEIILEFEKDFSEDSVKKALAELYRDGFISKPNHGYYVFSSQVKNFYDKDDIVI